MQVLATRYQSPIIQLVIPSNSQPVKFSKKPLFLLFKQYFVVPEECLNPNPIYPSFSFSLNVKQYRSAQQQQSIL